MIPHGHEEPTYKQALRLEFRSCISLADMGREKAAIQDIHHVEEIDVMLLSLGDGDGKGEAGVRK